MSSLLVVYGTGEGHTATVADRIATTIREHGHDTEVFDVDHVPPDLELDAFDAVLVGASIHMGTQQPAIRSFVTQHLDELVDKPSRYFQVCLSAAANDEVRQAEAAQYAENLFEATDWHPDRIGIFGGALRYSEYGFVKRTMMKRIVAEATGDTDTAHDYEYTDWEAVEQFATVIVSFVEDRLEHETVREAR